MFGNGTVSILCENQHVKKSNIDNAGIDRIN